MKLKYLTAAYCFLISAIAYGSEKEIIYFDADWCRPCIEQRPMVVSFVENNPEYTLTIYDLSKPSKKDLEYKVKAYPSIVLKHDGKVCIKVVNTKKTSIDELVNSCY
jgi:thiol-disulfide isomerase/thioredoxin